MVTAVAPPIEIPPAVPGAATDGSEISSLIVKSDIPVELTAAKQWLIRHPRTIPLLKAVIQFAESGQYPEGVSVPEVTGRLLGLPPGTRTNSGTIHGYVRQLAREDVGLISIVWLPTNTRPIVQEVRHLKPSVLACELAKLGILEEIQTEWIHADNKARDRTGNQKGL